MVEATLRMIDPNVPYTAVHASRGKVVRAEPVAALYEQQPGRVFHVGTFPTMEDQMCAFTTDFDRKTAGFSPDRVDALVWAFSDLLVEPKPGAAMIEFYRLRAREAAEKKAAAKAAPSATRRRDFYHWDEAEIINPACRKRSPARPTVGRSGLLFVRKVAGDRQFQPAVPVIAVGARLDASASILTMH